MGPFFGFGCWGEGGLHIINRGVFFFFFGFRTLKIHIPERARYQVHTAASRNIWYSNAKIYDYERVARASRCTEYDSRLTGTRGITVLSLKTTQSNCSCIRGHAASTWPVRKNLSTWSLTTDHSLLRFYSYHCYNTLTNKYTNNRCHQRCFFVKRIDNPMLYNELTVLTGTPNP